MGGGWEDWYSVVLFGSRGVTSRQSGIREGEGTGE